MNPLPNYECNREGRVGHSHKIENKIKSTDKLLHYTMYLCIDSLVHRRLIVNKV